MSTPEPTPRQFRELSPDEQSKVVTHLNKAVLYRAKQWDEELEIEKILGREIEVDMEYLASMIDDAAADPDEFRMFNKEDAATYIDG